MARVYISVGSNIDRAANVRSGIATLARHYGGLFLSSIYESEAVGFSGDNFYNLVVGFDTRAPVRVLTETLRGIELAHGRRRGAERFTPRTLDLDLLLYDDWVMSEDGVQLPRDEITRYAFVLGPLAEIAPGARHPVTGERYADMWAAFDKASQPMWEVEPQEMRAVQRRVESGSSTGSGV